MTWREALIWGRETLLEAQIPDATWDAETLFDYALGCNRTSRLLKANQVLSGEEEQRYRDCIEKREKHVPLQYITGEQEFMGLPFYVNQNVLIPRQDTECLVELVLKHIYDGVDSVRVLDMCTGSGCIGISIAKLALKGGKKAEVTCTDISPEVLQVAKKNAKLNEVEISFAESDLFEKLSDKFHIIVSNPPYITKVEMEELMPEVREYEPEKALYGMEDGLYFYREIVKQASKFLEENGMLFFEIGCNQGDSVSRLMQQAGFHDVRVEKDLAGLDRIVYGRI